MKRSAFEECIGRLKRYPGRLRFELSRDLLERLVVEMVRMNDAGLELVRKLQTAESETPKGTS